MDRIDSFIHEIQYTVPGPRYARFSAKKDAATVKVGLYVGGKQVTYIRVLQAYIRRRDPKELAIKIASDMVKRHKAILGTAETQLTMEL